MVDDFSVNVSTAWLERLRISRLTGFSRLSLDLDLVGGGMAGRLFCVFDKWCGIPLTVVVGGKGTLPETGASRAIVEEYGTPSVAEDVEAAEVEC